MLRPSLEGREPHNKVNMAQKKLRIIPLGGLGEVGKNMMAYEYGENILIVDVGIMFPENDMLGVDYIIPDIQYLMDKRDWVRGIIVTHGHEDHTGAIGHVLDALPVPVYATALTAGLLEIKMRQFGHTDHPLHVFKAGDVLQLGPFSVETFHVCHSIPDGVGLGINTPAGLIVHSSDFKFDHTPVDSWPPDFAKLAEFAQRGVLALLSDSTNADQEGWTPSERVIDRAFSEVFASAKGRVIVATFASCPVPEVARLGKTLTTWRAEFLAYFDTNGASNGGTEAMNGLIELHRRIARGFRNRDNYRLRMLLIGGGLPL